MTWTSFYKGVCDTIMQYVLICMWLSLDKFQTGLVSKKDALALIEDPCAAGIFAYHAIKPKIAKRNNIGTSYVSIDIGGVYLHSSGYDFHEGKLHQILTPSSQPISDSLLPY